MKNIIFTILIFIAPSFAGSSELITEVGRTLTNMPVFYKNTGHCVTNGTNTIYRFTNYVIDYNVLMIELLKEIRRLRIQVTNR